MKNIKRDLIMTLVGTVLGGLLLNFAWEYMKHLIEEPDPQLEQVDSRIKELNNQMNQLISETQNVTKAIKEKPDASSDLALKLADKVSEINDVSEQLSENSKKAVSLAKTFKDRQAPPKGVTEIWIPLNSSHYFGTHGNISVTEDKDDGAYIWGKVSGKSYHSRKVGVVFSHKKEGEEAEVTYLGKKEGKYGFAIRLSKSIE